MEVRTQVTEILRYGQQGSSRELTCLRIAVMPIDVHFADSTARSIVTSWGSIIADEGHNDASITNLVEDVLHVWSVWKKNAARIERVLVLGLHKNDCLISAIVEIWSGRLA